jgi:aerobic-type carbon monoxide dehydrogenase small subunit (CoxS/CutS family)
MAAPVTINLSINGAKARPISVADGAEPLLYVLRNQFGLQGPKFGCGVAQCGACTVHVNGAITRSCITRMNSLPDGAEITTLEGLTLGGKTRRAALRAALERAFVDQQAAQCGYCANAMIMGAAGWLESRLNSGNTEAPTEDEVKAFLSGQSGGSTYVYLCRCGTHLRILRAIQQAAREVR